MFTSFSPPAFSHPVWVNFSKAKPGTNSQTITAFECYIQEWLTNQEIENALSGLLLEAALQTMAGERMAARGSLKRASGLAARFNLTEFSFWIYWAQAALEYQDGKANETANRLEELQKLLATQGKWLLANLIELVRRAFAGETSDREVLRLAMDWLYRWGYAPEVISASYRPEPSRKEIFAKRVSRGRQYVQRLVHRALTSLQFRSQTGARSSDHRSAAIGSSPERQQETAETNHPTQISHSPSGVLSLTSDPPLNPPGEPNPIPPKQANERPAGEVLTVYCLGSFQAFWSGKWVNNWTSRKAFSIFKYLIKEHPQPVAKDILMDVFWPDAEPEAARRNLHQAIYALRQTLRNYAPEVHFVLFHNDAYLLNSDLVIWTDARVFEEHVRAAQKSQKRGDVQGTIESLEAAERLYQGDFMSDDLYEDWPAGERQILWQTYLQVAFQLADLYLARKDYPAVTGVCQRVLYLDEYQEKTHQFLIRSYLEQGQRQLALRQYRRCVQALETGLDLPPSAETHQLYQRILKT